MTAGIPPRERFVTLLCVAFLPPVSAKLLSDASAGRHLPTDVCAILGGTLTRRLIRAR